jgi:hypothetical protein
MSMTTIRGAKPGSVTQGKADRLRLKLDHIRKISVDNITRVKQYDLANSEDFVIHTIGFVNGGTAVLGYSRAGKIMRFQTNGINLLVKDGDHIILDT